MARKPRIQYAGAVYHVMCRGDRKQVIVEDDDDRNRFLETLAEVCERTGWWIYAYVLMSNHYHMLLETPEANLVDGMRWFQGTYTSRFNHRHHLSGHLFQGRYKALHVDPEDEGHFLTVSTYIHLNPIRARLVRSVDGVVDPKAYPWSSYPSYLLPPSKRPPWLEVGRVLGELGVADSASGRRQYARFMNRRSEEVRGGRKVAEWAPIRRGWMMGSDEFRNQLLDEMDRQMPRSRRGSYHGEAIAEHDAKTAEKLLDAGLARLRLSKEELAGLAKRDPRKQVLAWWIRKGTMVRNDWLAEQLCMGHVSAVSKSVQEAAATTDPAWQKWKRQLARIPGITA